ncbi:MAG: methyltransferase domain-containing protein [Chlamydiae bacterium]|nr:methyltransferase domain-containing protein [Chlamydiota bacterium]
MSSKLVIKKTKIKDKSKNGSCSLGPLSDLEKHLPSEWWKSLFNSIYLKTDGDVIENDENTKNEVDLIIKTTKIEPSDRILDLCCGQGRHCIELSRRGFFKVFGIDKSRYLIRLAKKRASLLNLHINFSEGDARRIKILEDSVDTVILMGNSFGYFEKEEDDIAVIESIKRILKSEGNLVLDIVDGSWMQQNFEPRSWEWIDQKHLVCRERSLSSDNSKIVSREVVIHEEKGIIADRFYAERLYSADAIMQLLNKCGYSHIERHSNFEPVSSRNQDLGMMKNRLFITAKAQTKKTIFQKQQKKLEISVILGDSTLPDLVKKEGKFNQEDLKTIETLKETLSKLSQFKFNFYEKHSNLIQRLIVESPSFILNLCDEGFLNDAFKEQHVPAILEMLQIPYSGAGPNCLGICYNKTLVRALADSIDIPVPLETYVDTFDQTAALPSIFPALLKPNYGDNSIGITKDAVVNSPEQLIDYLNKMREEFPNRAVLVQEFLPGREFSVALIGNNGNYKILPVLEVDYSDLPSDLPQILSYESKWIFDSPFAQKIKYIKSKLEEETYRQLIDYSIMLFERLECRDYARFDFREDVNGVIKLLEVNPNPGWCIDGKMNIMAGFDNLSYFEFLELIINSALERLNIKH